MQCTSSETATTHSATAKFCEHENYGGQMRFRAAPIQGRRTELVGVWVRRSIRGCFPAVLVRTHGFRTKGLGDKFKEASHAR